MASAFGHAAMAYVLGSFAKKPLRNWKLFLLGIICSIIPDADVISFSLGIPYESFWGHRGFSHSLVFALFFGIFISFLLYPKHRRKWSGVLLSFYFFLATASHSLLDAMTSGGLGVAFFSPFDNSRYFLPWRPIKVSPIGAENFFSEWAWLVLKSEALWIGLPCLFTLIGIWSVRKIKS